MKKPLVGGHGKSHGRGAWREVGSPAAVTCFMAVATTMMCFFEPGGGFLREALSNTGTARNSPFDSFWPACPLSLECLHGIFVVTTLSDDAPDLSHSMHMLAPTVV